MVHNESLAAMEQKLNLSLRVPLYSTSTGRPFPGKTATQFLENIVHEILTQSIKWGDVIEGIVQQAADSGAAQVKVKVFRVSLPIQELVTYANTKLSPEVLTNTEELVPWLHNLEPKTNISGPRGSMQSKIAIVGMACRMPGGADTTDKFWELLEAGLDVSRKIPADRFDVDTHFVGLPLTSFKPSSRAVLTVSDVGPHRQEIEYQSYALRLLHRRAWPVRCTVLQHVSPRGAADRSYAAIGHCHSVRSP